MALLYHLRRILSNLRCITIKNKETRRRNNTTITDSTYQDFFTGLLGVHVFNFQISILVQKKDKKNS